MSATVTNLQPYITERDEQDRIEKSEIAAGWYFDKATQDAKAEFDATMQSLLGTAGPKWTRERDAARAKFRDTTKEARKLFDQSVEEFLATGELSAATDEAWTALIVSQAMAQAAE